MCKLCDANEGELESCQDCGRLICFDHKTSDSVTATAYVTAAGDLFCIDCGREADAVVDEADRDEYLALWEDYPGEWLGPGEDSIQEVSDGQETIAERAER